MAPSEWNQVLELFHAALETSADARTMLLDQACGSETAIRKAVEDLLREHESAGSFLSRPVWDAAQTSASPELFAPESQFDCFVLKEVLGRGGMGEVWSARDLELDRLVALKFLRAHTGSDMEAARIVREAQAASALNHPNIVTIHGVVRSGGIAAIVMEFVDGTSLAVLRKAPIALEKVLAIGSQIGQALAAAHAHSIVHGDIKPENIVQRHDGYIKVLDFGLAHRVIAEGMSGAQRLGFGTMRYMSPEQARGESITPASDIFSFGLVLFELAAGRHPFADQSSAEAMQSSLTRDPPAPSSINPRVAPALNSLILAMLEKNPGARPPTAEVVRRLDRIAGESTRRLYRRRAWLAGGLLAVAAGSLLVTSLWTHKPSPMVLRLDAKPLTGEEGREFLPALSPDGRFIVYAWRPTAGSPAVTLLREVGSDRKTVLPIAWPFTWLPDNQHIGFVRRGKDQDTLCTILMDGSREQEILQARKMGLVEWSPEGDRIVYAAGTGRNQGTPALFLYSTRTRESRQLTFPSDSTLGDEQFAISPDGKEVAFRRLFTYLTGDIFLVNLSNPAPPRRLTFERVAGDSLAWIGGGKAIVSSLIRGANNSLWLYPLRSSEVPSRLTGVGIEATNVQSTPKRNRLAWVSALDDTNIWSVPLSGGEPRRVISSAMRDLDVATSSLGLLAFRSDRSGAPEIWISTGDGVTQKRVTNLNRRSGSPRWSPDGRRLVFDSHGTDDASDIYLMNCDPAQLQCDPPVRITDHPASDAIPNWSADGSSVYFASQRTGQWQLWKVPATQKLQPAVQVTTKGGFFATASPDGKWLYYSRVDSKQTKGVWRKPLPENFNSPGADDPGEMVVPLEQRSLATWVLAEHEILYSTFGDEGTPAALWAFDLKTRRTRIIHKAGAAPLARGLALSPEGTSVLFAQLDRWQSNIVIADYEIVR